MWAELYSSEVGEVFQEDWARKAIQTSQFETTLMNLIGKFHSSAKINAIISSLINMYWSECNSFFLFSSLIEFENAFGFISIRSQALQIDLKIIIDDFPHFNQYIF